VSCDAVSKVVVEGVVFIHNTTEEPCLHGSGD
jgi:hypothetical protein